MEIPEIQNWKDIQIRIANLIKKENLIIGDTQRDIYLYFEGVRKMQKVNVTCPYCNHKIELLELGLNPSPILDDWEDFDRSEPNSMTFGEIMKYHEHDLITEILYIIQSIEIKDRPLDMDIKKLSRNVQILKNIVQIIQDTPDAVKACGDDTIKMNICLIETIEDIRKTIIMEVNR